MEINTALLIARLAHKGQQYGNEPYINHITRVWARVRKGTGATHAAELLAILHDVVEDTTVTFEDLEDVGYYTPNLRLLTRRTGQTYKAYINAVKTSPLATRVKLADLRENLAHHPKTPSHLARYEAAVATLA